MTNPHVFSNSANSEQENCDLVSENTCPGIPCLDRMHLIFIMMNDARDE